MAIAETDMRIQMLDAQIVSLEAERATKLAELNACEKRNKNFKIAGLSTLALTGVGVYTNVKLNKKLTNGGATTVFGGGNMRDTRSQSDKDCSGARELFELGLATQEEVDATCNV